MKLLELNSSTIKFLTTPDGIRGAVYVGAKLLAPTQITYIHRYECAVMLGLSRSNDNSKNGLKIRWQLLYEKLEAIEEEFISAHDRTVGFMKDNKPSSERQPSKYELMIPEYIDSDAILLVAFNTHTESAKAFRHKVMSEVIPFYRKNASPEQNTDDVILRNTYSVYKQAELDTTSSIVGINPLEYKRNTLSQSLNRLAQLAQLIIYQKQDSHIIKDEHLKKWLKAQLDSYFKRVFDIDYLKTCQVFISHIGTTNPSMAQNLESLLPDNSMEFLVLNDFLFNTSLNIINSYMSYLETIRVNLMNDFSTIGYKGTIVLFTKVVDSSIQTYRYGHPTYKKKPIVIELTGNRDNNLSLDRTEQCLEPAIIREGDLIAWYIASKNILEIPLDKFTNIEIPKDTYFSSSPEVCQMMTHTLFAMNLDNKYNMHIDCLKSNVIFGDAPIQFVNNFISTPKLISANQNVCVPERIIDSTIDLISIATKD